MHDQVGMSLPEQDLILEELFRLRREAEAHAQAEATSQARAAARAQERPLLPRQVLERSLPRVKALAAAAGWGNSLVTGVLTGAQLQQAIWAHDHPGVPGPWPLTGVLLGVLLSIGCTVGQVFTIDRHTMAYRVFLAPDVATTAWQWWYWMFEPLSRIVPEDLRRWVVPILLLIPFMIGVFSAKLPERIVFGPRRKG